MLSTDMNNMFFHIKHMGEKNHDAIERLKNIIASDRTVIAELRLNFARLKENTQDDLRIERKDKVR